MSKPRPKRFYKDVTIAAQNNAFIIQLDGSTLKTPSKLTLVTPTQAIAQNIAEEWRAQSDHIRPETMPVTRLVNVALELTPKNRPQLIEEARNYAATDLLCYRDSPGALARHQAKHWDPVLEWAFKRGIKLKTAASVIAVTQDNEALDIVANFAKRLDDLHLTLFLHLTAVFGSAILALAVMENHLSGSQAFDLSRLDARWQNQYWGEDKEDTIRSKTLAAEVTTLCQIIGA